MSSENGTLHPYAECTVPDSDSLIFACALNGDGGARFFSWEELGHLWAKDRHVVWAHFNFKSRLTQEWVENSSHILPIFAEILLAEQIRPNLVIEDDDLLLTLKTVNYTQGAEPEDMTSIRLWITEKRIASFRCQQSHVVDDLKKKLQEGRGIKNSGDFLVELLDRIVIRMRELIEDMEEELDTLEEESLGGHNQGCRTRLITLRQQTVGLRKHLHPQRDVLVNLTNLKVPWLNESQKIELVAIAQKQTRYVEELDYIRERATILQEQLNGFVSESIMTKMYVLAIITCIFDPLDLIVGLWGTNVGGIPGNENRHGFLGVCLLLIVLASGMFLLLRRRRWF